MSYIDILCICQLSPATLPLPQRLRRLLPEKRRARRTPPIMKPHIEIVKIHLNERLMNWFLKYCICIGMTPWVASVSDASGPTAQPRLTSPRAHAEKPRQKAAVFRGNHLSNTTCLTQVFFKSGE